MNEKKRPADLVWADGDGDMLWALAPRKVPPTRSAAYVRTSGDGIYLTAAQCREVAAHLTELADYHEETMPRTAPALPTDPTALAREVLDDERAWAALDPGHHPESQAAVYRLANAAPDLARAVIDMTATIKRVEALACLLYTSPSPRDS